MSPPTLTISIPDSPGAGPVQGTVTFEDTSRSLNFRSRDPSATLQGYVATIRTKIVRYLAGQDPDESLRGAANSGWLLLGSLFGTVWEGETGRAESRFRNEILDFLRSDDGVVIIDSDTVHAPWNFLCFVRPGEKAAVGDFLGERKLVLQRLSMDGSLPPVWPEKILFAIHGGDDAMAAETDGIELHANSHKIALRRFPDDKKVVSGASRFEAVWKDANPSVVHIASHLIPAPPGLEMTSKIVIGKSAGVEVQDVLSKFDENRSRLALGFFNLCSLGESSYPLHGGTAAALALRLGCSISVDMKLHSNTAALFADIFYRSYLAGADAGEAYMRARQAVGTTDLEKIKMLCYRVTFTDCELLSSVA